MQFSVVTKSALENIAFRLDPEYYQPNYLHLYKKLLLKNHVALKDISTVTDGIHEAPRFDSESPINLISAKAPKENYFDLSSSGKISVEHDKKNPRTRLQINDVILSSTGTIGNCAVADESIMPANCDRDVGIIRIKNKRYKPRFISTFLLSKYGKFQSIRESTGNVQLHLFIYKIKEIIIPDFSENFQSSIENICSEANKAIICSAEMYYQAEHMLLSELGLLNWKPKHRLSFVKKYSDTDIAGRIDAEYFQPMYEEILNRSTGKVKTYKANEIFSFRRGDFIDTKYYCQQKTKRAYLRIKELSNNGTINSSEVIYLNDSFDGSPSNTLKENDIVMAIIGDTIGKSNLILKEFVGSYFSNNTGRFRLRPEAKDSYDAFYLETLFHSIYIQSQIERAKAQTGQPKISDKEVQNILIPCLPLNKQRQIGENIKKAIENKNQSKYLLDIAKRGVEMAIEKDEAIAERWIKAEVKKLGVEVAS